MKIWWTLVLVLAVAIAGCSGGKKEAKQTEQTGAQVQQQQQEPPHTEMPQPIHPPKFAEAKPAGSSAPKPSETAPTPSQAATGPVTKVVKLPAGYEFQVVLDEKVSTETHRAGTPFVAKLVQPAVLSTGIPVIPTGSKIRGEITFSQRAGRVGGKADLTLEYRELVTPDGTSYPLFADPLILEGKGTAKGDIERTVGGTVGGAIIGGILGGKKGAVEGGAAGGAAGAAWAIATRGNDIVVDPGQVLQVTLTRALHVTATVPQ